MDCSVTRKQTLCRAWRILPCCRSRGNSATIGGWNSLTLQGRREHHQHRNCLPLVLLGRAPQHKRASHPSQGKANYVVNVEKENSPYWVNERLQKRKGWKNCVCDSFSPMSHTVEVHIFCEWVYRIWIKLLLSKPHFSHALISHLGWPVGISDKVPLTNLFW